MEIVHEKQTEVLRAFLLSAAAVLGFLLLVLVFAFACGSWLLPESAAPACVRGLLFLLTAGAVGLAVHGCKNPPVLPAAAACSLISVSRTESVAMVPVQS